FSNVNLFRVVMRADGDTMTVSEVTLTLGFSGLAPGGVTGLVLFEDTTGDGLPDGGPVTATGTVTSAAASWTGLSLMIKADRARSFIVQGTVSDTQAGDRLTISLPVTGVVSRNRRDEAIPVIGAVSTTAHIAGTFVLADAPSGQSSDQFRNAATAVDKDFFRFVLRTTGKAVMVTRLAFGLSFAQLTPQQLTAFRLLEDTTGDGVPDGGPLANSPAIRPDSLMFTGLALSLPAGGTRTFILRGTVQLSRVGDRLAVGLAPDGVVARNDSGSGVTVSGATSSAVHHAAGVPGDVTFDLILDVRDVVKEIRVALNIIPIDGPLAFFDVNGDEAVDIVDLIAIIQRIVTGNVPVRRLAQPSDLTAHLTLQDVSINADGVIELIAALQSSGPLAGFEVTFVSSDRRVRWSEPLIAGRADGMTLASHGRDGTMRLMIYSPTGGRIPAGDGPLVRLRLSLAASDTGGTGLTVLKARGVDVDVRPVPVAVPAKPAVLTVPPRAYALHQNVPNPFNPATVIRYDLPKPGQVTLTIYNLLGQAVVTLVDARQDAGRYAVRWDGRNAAGQPVASGLYFYRLTTGAGFTAVRKMVVVR
ncbi:MAG: T9SS type A sorting domain-containing protein, partial [Candidatus Latescibacteria bacterium]|nr:T9SS type A sorting domain-containing protein [Candidatus Latescibacterota bacterium]